MHAIFLKYSVKEYEDDFPFDGNGVINPRHNAKDGEQESSGNEGNNPSDYLSDDEEAPFHGSGNQIIFPNDPR